MYSMHKFCMTSNIGCITHLFWKNLIHKMELRFIINKVCVYANMMIHVYASLLSTTLRHLECIYIVLQVNSGSLLY